MHSADDGPALLRWEGPCTLAEADLLRRSLLDVIAQTSAPVVVLDQAAAAVLAAGAAGILVGAHTRLRADGRELRLAALQPPVLRALQLMKLAGQLHIFFSDAAACDGS